VGITSCKSLHRSSTTYSTTSTLPTHILGSNTTPYIMSRVNHLISQVRTLHPTPLRTGNTTQLSNALENILHRAFPAEASSSTSSSASASASASSATSSTSEVGSAVSAQGATSGRQPITQHEKRAVERMIASVERIKSGAALKSVSEGILFLTVVRYRYKDSAKATLLSVCCQI
jgi:hypothetical protein